ncbi:MAG: hypothetical protein R3B06_06435 [Kofleriaceae bacterium]
MGFGFAETMQGTWHRADDGEVGRFAFTVKVSSGPLAGFQRTRLATMSGTVDVAGLATRQPLAGTMELRPWLGRRIRYRFEFTGDDGERYGFDGQKDIRWLDARRTWTELPGEITDAGGRLVGTAKARFDLRADMVAFVRSFHLA